MSQTILTVDPSPVCRRSVAVALIRAGYDVVQARDGRDALNKAGVVSFDLVIVDHDPPHVDALAMIRVLRARPAYAGRPILVLAGEADDATRQAARSASATGWLPRRVDPRTLLDVVGTAIGRPWTLWAGANGPTLEPARSRRARRAAHERVRPAAAVPTVDPAQT